ncbi:MAG: hypothetical protein GYA24_24580 [Candidatus Lokiarchaeota archaeon]|nr:hypothetical protein [Candidatus Lokiarchaeota archaeon]
MLARILPALSAIASWLHVDDQAQALRIMSTDNKGGPALVAFKIVDMAKGTNFSLQ